MSDPFEQPYQHEAEHRQVQQRPSGERFVSALLRPATPEDAPVCGAICYEAFRSIALAHGFPPDFPSAEAATGLLADLIRHPHFSGVVAEIDGRVVGSNFLDERSTIAGVGPVTVDPPEQNRGVGQVLMEAVLKRASDRDVPGVRLLQAAYHARSLALYSRLGFEPREAIACLQGAPLGLFVDGYDVWLAVDADAAAANRVCRRVHGHDRAGELDDAIRQGSALVVEHDGEITGYATDLAFFAHAVAETNDGLKALIGAAKGFGGPGILVPLRNGSLFRWCLDHGQRVVHVMTLMTIGLYNEPDGAYLPSVLY